MRSSVRVSSRAAGVQPRGAIGEAPPVPGRAIAPSPRPSLLGLIRLWLWRVRSRRELGELDMDRLRDVGIHPRVARREAEKPFWRA
ncbi:DUF1127 domain-containing protein [Xanthobacteraceae bacterium A53D]